MTTNKTHFISEPMKIGRHEWRIGVGTFSMPYSKDRRCTFYEWRKLHSQEWNSARSWPRYDINDTYNGMPKTLKRLYDRENVSVRHHLTEPED